MGNVPSPMLAPYSAAKAFIATFTSALAEEVRQDNVTVEYINTYFVVRLLLFAACSDFGSHNVLCPGNEDV